MRNSNMDTIKFLLAIIAIILLWMVGFWQWIFALVGSVLLFLGVLIEFIFFNQETIGGIVGFLIAIAVAGVIISPLLLIFKKVKFLKELKDKNSRLYDGMLVISAIVWTIVAVTTYFWIAQGFQF